jgi:hypothetical protein
MDNLEHFADLFGPSPEEMDVGTPLSPGSWCGRCVRSGTRLGWRTLGLMEIALHGRRLAEGERGRVMDEPQVWIPREITTRLV